MGEQLVVVGVDGSTASYTALRWVLSYAGRTGACVRACGALLCAVLCAVLCAGVGERPGSGGHCRAGAITLPVIPTLPAVTGRCSRRSISDLRIPCKKPVSSC
jgi:hypothetical protein